MLKSIQWKLVVISFLLVWLSMSIVGVYITQAIEKEQTQALKDTISYSGENLARLLKDKTPGSTEIQNVVTDWFVRQSKSILSVYILQNGNIVAWEPKQGAGDDNNQIIERLSKSVLGEKKIKIINTYERNNNYKSFGIPIISDGSAIGMIYISADFTSVGKSMKTIGGMLSSSTILALCITVLLGSILARTITGPIKEVTSKAEKLAQGEFGQVIEVKSNDEVGQLTEMFNYLTIRLKSTLDEMYSEKNKMETILTNMTDGIIAVSTSGDILHANPEVFSIFGIKSEDIKDKNFDDIARELELGVTCADLFSVPENSNRILNINNLMIRANVVKFQNEKNETVGAIIVLQDVTEQEKLDKMRKEFVANVSHELRTPLTTIKSYTETLLDGALDNKEYATNFLKVIDSESDRMTRLVKDLLQLSKMEYDKVEWNLQKTNIARLAQDCINRMAISAKQKNQQLSAVIVGDIPEVNVDKDRIEQVIVNIVNNAIKYTPDNGTINVSVSADAQHIIIKVADSGIGIPKEDLPRLFERFYRVDKARSRMMGGTGLGLSIAKQIVEAHRGYISIDSEYGKGTEVSICLPCA